MSVGILLTPSNTKLRFGNSVIPAIYLGGTALAHEDALFFLSSGCNCPGIVAGKRGGGLLAKLQQSLPLDAD